MSKRRPATILLAEDDEDDYFITREAFRKSRVLNRLYRVGDGEELLEYLYHRGRYADGADAPLPSLILLDLNMPRMDGREALARIKSDPALRRIPVVALTTSSAEEDVLKTYELGANSFIKKPVTMEGFIHSIHTLEKYWFELVELPPPEGA